MADNGVPTLTDAESFQVIVVEASALHIDIAIRDSVAIAISWNSVPGTVYRLEFKDRMDDLQWQTLEDVVAIGTLTVATDEARNGQRFYRVKVLR